MVLSDDSDDSDADEVAISSVRPLQQISGR